MINNFLFYDNGILIGYDCLSIKDGTNINNTFIVTNDCIFTLYGLVSKIPIYKSLHTIFIKEEGS